jgi:hypothetical protein
LKNKDEEFQMFKTALIIALLGLTGLLLTGCGGPSQPEIGTPGRVSLVFFYTEA